MRFTYFTLRFLLCLLYYHSYHLRCFTVRFSFCAEWEETWCRPASYLVFSSHSHCLQEALQQSCQFRFVFTCWVRGSVFYSMSMSIDVHQQLEISFLFKNTYEWELNEAHPQIRWFTCTYRILHGRPQGQCLQLRAWRHSDTVMD